MCNVSNSFFFFHPWAGERDQREHAGSKGRDTQVRLLMYADDIVLLSETKRDLQKMLDIVIQQEMEI